MRRLILISLATASAVFATTTIDRIEPTQQQAIVVVKTDQTPSTCVIHASFGTSLGTDIADIADNGTTATRVGTLISGKYVKFVIGQRRGNWSLAASNTYTAGVTCGADSQVTKTFATKPIPWGNLAPCDIPFNASKPFNADWPDLDFNPTDYAKMYADPCTGAEYYLNNTIGFASAYYGPASASRLLNADDVDGLGTWTNLGNISTTTCTPGTSCAHGTGGPSDKLFVPIAVLPKVGYLSSSLSPYGEYDGHVDDYILDVYCGNSPQNETLTIQLSMDHGQTVVGTPQTVTCPTGSFAKIKTVPQLIGGGTNTGIPQPPFLGWGYIPNRNQASSTTGTADVNGTIVTANSGIFYTNGEMGPFIRINGAEEPIASVDSPTQMTLAVNLGVLSNVNWASCESGFVVTKSGTGALDLALGLNWAASRGDGWGQDANWPWANWAPVTVSYQADGTTPMPSTKGYLAYNTNADLSAVYLWIPKNADGTVRNERRLLSSMQIGKTQSNVHMNGDAGSSAMTLVANDAPGSAWTGDATSLIVSQIAASRLWKMVYYTQDETRLSNTGVPCSRFPAYSPGAGTGSLGHGTYFGIESTPNPPVDCFDYYDMTPGGYVNMILNAYTPVPSQMGKPTWLANSFIQNTLGNKILVMLQASQNNLSLVGLIDVSGTSPVVSKVWDTWSGTGQSAGAKFPSLFRWGGIHSCTGMSTKYAFCSNGNIWGTTSGTPLGGHWDMQIARVSRANWCPGDTCNSWTTDTHINVGEAYTCPATVTPEQSVVAGTNSCIKVEVSTPPCSSTPYPGTAFFGGLTEKQAFPCSTPDGNGGTLGIADSTKSKLQDLRAGDSFVDTSKPQNELFTLVTDPQYVGVNQIQFWVSRWNYQRWQGAPFNNPDENDTGSLSGHTNGWTAEMQVSYSTDGNPGRGQGALVPLDGSNELFQYGLDEGCHAATSPVGTAGNISFMMDGCTSFRAAANIDPSVSGMTAAPIFGKADNFQDMSWAFGNLPQSYPALGDTAVQSIPIGSDYHSFLSGNGGVVNDSHGSPTILWSTAPALVAGTSHTYTINVKPAAASATVYKRQPYLGTAGRFVLRDVSGTGPYAGDLPDNSFCIPLSAGECYPGSTVGKAYVSVPGMDTSGSFYEANFSTPAPGVFTALPHTGAAQIYRIDGRTGFPIHKILGYPMVPGTTYTFSNCRFAAGEFLWCIAQHAGDKFTTQLIYHIHPEQGFDSIDHSKFIPITPSVTGVSWATYARARFGYLENGTNPATNTYRCTNYAADCSTDPPVSSADWYSFVTSWDVGTRVACTAGQQCKMPMNLISGRVAFYVVDRLAADGTVLSTSAPQVLAVP